MTIAGNQPYLFPYIGFWQTIHSCNTFVIADSMQYIKQKYVCRNNILLHNKAHQFVLQTHNKKKDSQFNDIQIGNNANKILKSIAHAYNKAPYYSEVYPLIERILMNKEKNLTKYVGYSIKEIVNYLNIDTKIIYLSDIQKETTLKAQNRVIDICKRLQANKLVDTTGAQKIYNKEDFLKSGIILSFLKPDDIKYKQFNDDFIPNLSIIDVLMFNGKERTKELLQCYTLF